MEHSYIASVDTAMPRQTLSQMVLTCVAPFDIQIGSSREGAGVGWSSYLETNRPQISPFVDVLADVLAATSHAGDPARSHKTHLIGIFRRTSPLLWPRGGKALDA
jgi:hypothetical protein